eukprot:6824017-Pyramimonas_sp.AAC.1
MQYARFSNPPARPGRLGPPVRVYPPDLPLWFRTCLLLLAPFLLLSVVLHPPFSHVSLPSIRPLVPSLRCCAKYPLQ